MSASDSVIGTSSDLRERLSESTWVLLGAAVVCALLLFPLVQATYLPLTDLPNHIARHTIMAEVGQAGGGALAEYYTSQFVIVPNSAVDLLWRLLGYPGDAVTFSHRMMSFAAINLFLSAVVLARVIHGQWTAWSLASGLMVYNCTYLFGFQNCIRCHSRPLHSRCIFIERPLGFGCV